MMVSVLAADLLASFRSQAHVGVGAAASKSGAVVAPKPQTSLMAPGPNVEIRARELAAKAMMAPIKLFERVAQNWSTTPRAHSARADLEGRRVSEPKSAIKTIRALAAKWEDPLLKTAPDYQSTKSFVAALSETQRDELWADLEALMAAIRETENDRMITIPTELSGYRIGLAELVTRVAAYLLQRPTGKLQLVREF